MREDQVPIGPGSALMVTFHYAVIEGEVWSGGLWINHPFIMLAGIFLPFMNLCYNFSHNGNIKLQPCGRQETLR